MSIDFTPLHWCGLAVLAALQLATVLVYRRAKRAIDAERRQIQAEIDSLEGKR